MKETLAPKTFSAPSQKCSPGPPLEVPAAGHLSLEALLLVVPADHFDAYEVTLRQAGDEWIARRAQEPEVFIAFTGPLEAPLPEASARDELAERRRCVDLLSAAGFAIEPELLRAAADRLGIPLLPAPSGSPGFVDPELYPRTPGT